MVLEPFVIDDVPERVSPNFSLPNPLPPPGEYIISPATLPGGLPTNRMTNVQFVINTCGAYDALVNVRTNPGIVFTNIFGSNIFVIGGSRDISVVFIPTNGFSTNVKVAVAFPTNPFTSLIPGAPIVEFRSG